MAERIRQQLDQLAEGDRQRRELVANVSHDLRTPLTQLQGYLETLTLDEGASDAARREYLRIALRQSERLGHLIGELFELAKLEAGELPLHRESFSVAELAQDVLQKYQLGASKRGVRMELEGPPDLAPVSADLGLIERVLDNLLDNALRYTPTGGRVAVAITPDRERVSIEVRDTGPGIAAADLPRIFERFYRSRTAAADGSGGGGLGLAIAKRALELHTTELHCASEPGVGTTFRFDLPRFETVSP